MSDDNPSSRNLANVLSFIDQVAALGEHYEHYDYHMGGDGRNASSGPRGYYGDFISGPGDWSGAPESLTIMTALGRRASPLTPGGKLTSSGREFHWNGRQVSLFGCSLVGAFAKNYDLNGYLDVLADHGVWHINASFIQRVLRDLAGYGNVIFESMNEPLEDWSTEAVRDLAHKKSLPE